MLGAVKTAETSLREALAKDNVLRPIVPTSYDYYILSIV